MFRILIAILSFACGCYVAEIDPQADGLFACTRDTDCSIGQTCDEGLCRSLVSQLGPVVSVESPAPLEAFPLSDDPSVPLVVNLGRFSFDIEERGVSTGFLELRLDGEVLTTVEDGDDDILIDYSLLRPQQPGLHHLNVTAMSWDGSAYENNGASVTVAFWVDDGREHVGIVQPAPGEQLDVSGQSLPLEVASLNLDMINPAFLDPAELPEPGQGYVKLFINRGIPQCLPDCSEDYDRTILPPGVQPLNQVKTDYPLSLLPTAAGEALSLHVVAHSDDLAPYLRDAADGDELVYHAAWIDVPNEAE